MRRSGSFSASGPPTGFFVCTVKAMVSTESMGGSRNFCSSVK